MTKAWLKWTGVCAALAMGAAAAQGCGSNGGTHEGPTDAGEPSDAGADSTVEGGSEEPGDANTVLEAGPTCDPDAQVDIDCTGLCGPVHDTCGHSKMCGGCQPIAGPDGGAQAQVCDLTTNTCTVPKTTCAELGAQCGTVRDSCGDYLDCPDSPIKGCPAGEECNPDTHLCQDCEQVTCADLGYQCGFAYLGCGLDTESNYTDCGQCPNAGDGGAQVCNATLHTCEPKCTPKSAAVICAAAKAALGVQCGFITDGCGGIVECDSNVIGFGCAAGEQCGVRGIANHCDPFETPDECVGQGRVCGDITSLCTGQKVHCGDCATGQVCGTNGTCGPPCTEKTCADYVGYQCGTFDDGCGSTITCGTCAGGICDQTTNTCCPEKQCGTDYAHECGTALPNGCGGNSVSCTCATATKCTADGGAAAAPANGAAGACCSPHAASFYTGQNECGTKLPDGCGSTINVSCPSGQECVANTTGDAGPAPGNGVVGTCCTPDCSSIGSGSCGSVQDSCRPTGTMHTCNECGAQSCMNSMCCTPAATCSLNGAAGGECNDVKTAGPNCGSNRTCTCSGNLVCWCTDHQCTASDGTGACKAPLTCGSGTYAGSCGTGLDDGAGGTLDCPCATGQVCSTSTPGSTGTCGCNNPTGAKYTCSNVPNGPGQSGGDACGSFDDGCGGTLTCNCAGGKACNTSAAPNVCCSPATCPAAGIGSACGAVNNGCTTINCSCPSGTGNENFACTGGECTCVKNTCHGLAGVQDDGCGGKLNCGT